MTDNIDIESLLDGTLDDIEDLPEFKPFPGGVHRALISLELKEVNGNVCVEATLKAMETQELSDPTKDEPLKEGDETTLLFLMNNEFGRGKFKLVAAPLAEALGTTTNREVIEQTTDIEVLVATSVRVDKTDKEKLYTNIKELAVV